MIDEAIIIDKLEDIKNESKRVMKNKYMKQKHLEYLLDKLREMISFGMYYHKDDTFFLEHVENNTSDFKISIKIEPMKQFLKTILEAN